MPSLAELSRQLADNPDGVLERVAEAHGVTTLTVVQHLPQPHRTLVSGDRLAEVLECLRDWGEVLLIINTGALIAEIKTEIPAATPARGYLNFHGDAPFGGHLKEEACIEIAFVDRPFFGRRSLSVQFFESSGACLFKVFVRRDENRELLSDQVLMFEALRDRFASQNYASA
ncbi:MAG: heme utilization cystosolic carrier protein HutX [Pseudomonadota bacterium]